MPGTARVQRSLLALLPGAFLFWALRIGHWLITHELPFSDMLSYETFGRNVAGGSVLPRHEARARSGKHPLQETIDPSGVEPGREG